MNLIKFFKKNYALQNMKKSKENVVITGITISIISNIPLPPFQNTNIHTQAFPRF